MSETKQIIVQDQSLLLDVTMFEHAQRVGKMLATSTMIPDHFKNNIGNCVIALNYAARAGIDPFMAMQKMYIIHGKPAVETQLQIALFNKDRRFSPLKYKISGEGDNRQCVAYATEKETGDVIEGTPVSIKMAKDEGWFSKNGSKWKTLPDLMLRYRAAAFFIRLYAPETTLGLYTKEELADMGEVIDITPSKAIDETIDAEISENAGSGEVIDIDPDKKPPTDPPPQGKDPEPETDIVKGLKELQQMDNDVFQQAKKAAGVPITKPFDAISETEFKKINAEFNKLIDAKNNADTGRKPSFAS